MAMAMGLGGTITVILLFIVSDQPASGTVALVALLGVIGGEAMRQALS